MKTLALATTLLACVANGAMARPVAKPHNVIIFVADGLRSGIVDDTTAPEMARIRREGVDFHNSHSLYPTITTVNASAIATGHRIGDTGDFGNSIWVGQSVVPGSPSPFVSVENNDHLRGLAKLYDGNYLNEESLLATARRAGFQTAAVGKLGPAWVQDVTGDPDAVLIDDATGRSTGRPLSPALLELFAKAGVDPVAVVRGANGDEGTFERAGTKVPNAQQQDWMTAVATKVLLPMFKAKAKPFVMVFWSRDPDGSQHGQGDSLGKLTPGINGPTALAGIKNADTDLGRLRAALKAQGLDKTTDIFVTADHGFSVASKESATSEAAKIHYPNVAPNRLPPRFLPIDLGKALSLKLWDAAMHEVDPTAGVYPRSEGVLLGADPQHPELITTANGGSELIYLPNGDGAKAMLAKVMTVLTSEDYVGGIFVDDTFGLVPGALPLSAIGLVGSAKTPRPSIVVSFKSFATGCAHPELCTAEVADTSLQQGQGIHGSFSRANTHNFMAATGPDFRRRYRDPAPVSNADIAPTLARVLGLKPASHGSLTGRVALEALASGKTAPTAKAVTVRSKPAAGGFVTVLNTQTLGDKVYLDAAGMPGRVVGLKP